MTSAPVMSVRDLRIRYGAFEAVKGVSFELPRGGIHGIVGESGSGKSTIASALIGLKSVASGEIVMAPGVRLAMIFQDAVGSLNPRMTVRSTLAETLAHGRAGVVSEPPRIEALLDRVGLSGAVLDQYPRELSGGQCQRVSVARALATGPDALIADEPVSALDVSVQARILNLLRDLRRETGLSILLIAHDLAVVRNVCDTISVMERGRFVDSGDADSVFSNPTSEYTRRLLACVPRI